MLLLAAAWAACAWWTGTHRPGFDPLAFDLNVSLLVDLAGLTLVHEVLHLVVLRAAGVRFRDLRFRPHIVFLGLEVHRSVRTSEVVAYAAAPLVVLGVPLAAACAATGQARWVVLFAVHVASCSLDLEAIAKTLRRSDAGGRAGSGGERPTRVPGPGAWVLLGLVLLATVVSFAPPSSAWVRGRRIVPRALTSDTTGSGARRLVLRDLFRVGADRSGTVGVARVVDGRGSPEWSGSLGRLPPHGELIVRLEDAPAGGRGASGTVPRSVVLVVEVDGAEVLRNAVEWDGGLARARVVRPAEDRALDVGRPVALVRLGPAPDTSGADGASDGGSPAGELLVSLTVRPTTRGPADPGTGR